MQLNGSRAETFGSLRRLLGRGLVTGADAEEALTLVKLLFDADAILLAQACSFKHWSVTMNVPDAYVAMHMKYEAQDTSRPYLARMPKGETYLIDRDSTVTEKDSDLYWHLRDQQIRDVMVATIHNPFTSDLMTAIYRTEDAAPFDAEDEELFRTLYPHLVSALAARRALAALDESRDETAREVLARLDGHVYLVMPAGTVTWSSRARRLVRDALDVSGDQGWSRVDAVLRRSAEQFHSPLTGGRSQLLVPGIRVEWATVPPQRGERQRLLGMFIDERGEPAEVAGDAGACTPAEALLTTRQRTVARLAAAGATTTMIGASLGISPETVRWTLREIYRRLGIHSRAQLATLVHVG